jgi:hypothetical protein
VGRTASSRGRVVGGTNCLAGHIHAHIEQDPDGNGYTWSISTIRDVWMGVAQTAEEARAIVNVHLKGIIKTNRHKA